MAVVPTLANMAALTLFHTTGYADGSVDEYWQPYNQALRKQIPAALRIQRTIRSYLVRGRALLGSLGFKRRLYTFSQPDLSRFMDLYMKKPVGSTVELAERATRIHASRIGYKFRLLSRPRITSGGNQLPTIQYNWQNPRPW